MDRRSFLGAALVGTTAAFSQPECLLEFVARDQKLTLPLLTGGTQTVTLLRPAASTMSKANAQGYAYPYNAAYNADPAYYMQYMQNMMAYEQAQNMMAYEQALRIWEQEMAALLRQQEAWMRDQHVQRMRVMMAHYQGHNQISSPNPWNSIESIYGVALDHHQPPTFFGLNGRAEPVAIQKTLRAAGSVFDKVSDYYKSKLGEKGLRAEQEKTVGPQTPERPVRINIKDEHLLTGMAYKTKHGNLGVTNQQAETADGTIGQIAKFSTKDGDAYEIV